MKLFNSLLLLFLCISCGSVRVSYDYERETDFTNYTTYNYYPDMETGLSEFDTRRLLRVLDNEMQSKGILLSEEPDFLINITSNTFQGAQNNSVGVGLGGGGRNVGGGVSIGIPVGQPKLERQIRFDFVDSQKDALFWSAQSESAFKEDVTPEIREQKLREIVQKVLSKYPPK
ncbi:DUF4136 domain-containing protein [Costertonia aggregata]|uniref:DUF4136 domain-containing protein n=2 Tax=Costertonia aggregata TaxID=343403 RepID=A0A7H9AWJ7_9FLAO|nr:DUF4136 domain-containing protein [Costertonia aggregata]